MREYGLGPALLVGVGLLVVLSPLLFLRIRGVGRRTSRWVFLGLSIVWLAVAARAALRLVALVIGD